MAKEKLNYFDYFYKVSDLAYKQAQLLHEKLSDFDSKKIQETINEMHSTEHQADMLKRDMNEFLIKDFLPPFDRDDIMALSDLYDTVCDTIDEVLLKLYMYNIKKCRSDIGEITKSIVDICNELRDLTSSLNGFKNSQLLIQKVAKVNDIEDVGDKLYIDSVNKLFKDNRLNDKSIVAWNSIYDCLENCFDACENVADEIRNVIIKNS